MIERIGCLSYAQVGYGSPQIRYLLESLGDYFGLRQPIGILAPRFDPFPDVDEETQGLFVHRLPRPSATHSNLGNGATGAIDYCRRRGFSRVAFYGAGSHTRELLRAWEERSGPRVRQLIVTRRDGSSEFLGIPLVQLDELEPSDLDLVVLSSVNFEVEMARNLASRWPGLRFRAIYRQELSQPPVTSARKRRAPTGPDHLTSWVEALEPDLLVCTFHSHLRVLLESRHKPRHVIYYCLEHPGGVVGSGVSESDIHTHALVKSRISLALFPERRRMLDYHRMFDYSSVPSAIVYNTKPAVRAVPRSFEERNGRVLLQGSLVEGKTYVEYLPQRRESQIEIDAVGHAYDIGKTVPILTDARLGAKYGYRYLGLLSAAQLSGIRPQYSYSLVMWNPMSLDTLHACPNKLFESVIDGVPPICAPHPQCKEIIERFDCGILMKDWSFESYSAALRHAEEILGTDRYRTLVENCRAAVPEICWEKQFDGIRPLLPGRKVRARARSVKFVLVDPTLENEVGHHLVYAANVLRPAREAGLVTCVGLNRNFIVQIPSADRLHPVFRYNFWGRDTALPERPLGLDAPQSFVDGVRRILGSEKPSGRDHVFVPNISDRDLEALADWAAHQSWSTMPSWHIILRHDVPPDSDRRVKAVRRLRESSADRVFFYTDTEELSKQHERATGVAFETLPIPVLPVGGCGFNPPAAHVGPLTAAYIGDARREKGFCELPALIAGCGDLMDRGALHFSVQCNSPTPEPDCELAIRILRRLARRYPVRLISERLSRAAYDESVHHADIILALYDRECYLRRSSHVVMEGLCYGKAVVVTRGTSPAAMLRPDSPWLAEENSAALRPLRWIVENPEESMIESARLQAEMARRHTGERLLDALLCRASRSTRDRVGSAEPACQSSY